MDVLAWSIPQDLSGDPHFPESPRPQPCGAMRAMPRATFPRAQLDLLVEGREGAA